MVQYNSPGTTRFSPGCIFLFDLVDDLSSDAKLFSDGKSLFTVVYDENIAADQLEDDLKVVSDWAYQWKIQLNSDKTKQAIFSQKKETNRAFWSRMNLISDCCYHFQRRLFRVKSTQISLICMQGQLI